MLNLKKAKLPEAVEVSGSFYKIHTDFRYWLMFLEVTEQESPLLTDFDFIYIDAVPDDRQEGINALSGFFSVKRALPRSTGEDSGVKAIDYTTDADLIFAAFYEQYGLDLTEAKLHWHKFSALMGGLHDTLLSKIIEYRLYDGDNAEMLKIKEAWRLETDEDVAADEAVRRFDDLLA